MTPPIYKNLVSINQKMLWDKQPGENNRAWMNFCIFRDFGPDRTLAKVAASLGKRNTKRFKQWADKYDWYTRAEAYDEYLDKRWQESDAGKKALRAEKHTKFAELMQRLGAEQIAAHIRKWEAAKAVAAQTGELPMPTMKAETAVKVVKMGVELDRILHNESVDAPEEGARDLSKLSVEELRKMRELELKATK